MTAAELADYEPPKFRSLAGSLQQASDAVKYNRVLIDFETFSELPLGKTTKNVGVWRYAEHFSTEILCMAYTMPGCKTKLWTPAHPFPQEVIDAVEQGFTFEAHNAQFERSIWLRKLLPLGIPMPKRWRDTLAACAYRALPLGLDQVGEALDLHEKKDQRGSYLINTLCKPKKPSKKDPLTRRWDYGLFEELYKYCMQDNDTEKALGDAVGDLPDPEQRIWVLDQKINQRGLRVDVPAVKAAIRIADVLAEKHLARLVEVTDDFVQTGKQVAKIMEWLKDHDWPMDNLKAATVEDAVKRAERVGLKGTPVHDVLKIRQSLAKSSTAKLGKILQTLCEDGFLRGLLQYHGAGTGRWAGRLAQLQNLPRGDIGTYCKKLDMSPVEVINHLIDAIMIADIDDDAPERDKKLMALEALGRIEDIFGDPVMALASAIRGMFISRVDHRFLTADFSSIEARVLMWIAREEKALEAFRAYDRGEGPDIYCVMASELYGRAISKKDDPEERQLGKITILGCGYQMGPPRLQEQAEVDYNTPITDEQSKFLVYGFRETYDKVPDMWAGLEEAALDAVRHPGTIFRYNNIAYQTITDKAGHWLTCILPGGRRLWYYDPEIEERRMPWGKLKDQLSYMGRDNKRGGIWGRVYTYGGMLTENVVQAIARDIMVGAMGRVELKGYMLVLTIHDEMIADVPNGLGSLDEFMALMCGPLAPFFEGCPIAVDGWSGPRYHKS